jgi:hypothetical protein
MVLFSRPLPNDNRVVLTTGPTFSAFREAVKREVDVQDISDITFDRIISIAFKEQGYRAYVLELEAHNTCPICRTVGALMNAAHRRCIEANQEAADAAQTAAPLATPLAAAASAAELLEVKDCLIDLILAVLSKAEEDANLEKAEHEAQLQGQMPPTRTK